MKCFFVSLNGFPARKQLFEAVPLTEPRRCRCDANPLLLQRCRGARHTPRVNYQGDPLYPVAAQDLRAEPRIFVGGSGFFLRPDHVFRYPRLSKHIVTAKAGLLPLSRPPHASTGTGPICLYTHAAYAHRSTVSKSACG